MISEEKLFSMDTSAPESAASALTAEEIADLIPFLSRKEDAIRYPAFLLLQSRSRQSPDVVSYWETFRKMLPDANSYQRSIGVMLLAANARWADEGLVRETLTDIAPLLTDEKPVTIRQCVASLETIGTDVPSTRPGIRRLLMAVDLLAIRETMRKLVLTDILHALIVMKDTPSSPDVDAFIVRALTGDILDAKTKKQLGKLAEGEAK